ncbi:MAG TPA: beta-galactosidase, partial [Bacteroidales bacterium]|nr:beta-galactosidase [Bacteroidales bacterium]
MCKNFGLTCILKPGPFILAEMRGAGLPYWLTDKYGDQFKMRNRKGVPVQSDGVSFFHPLFLEKVEKWYDQVMPLIAANQQSNAGPVIMMQLCNEIGVFAWLAHQADYSEHVRVRFIAYLQNKFQTIGQLNQLWGLDYKNFDDIELPPDGSAPYTSPGDRSRDNEWHSFWRTCYGDYLRMLTVWVRQRGVTVPLYHNLPGWIYGSGYDFLLNITMYDDLYGGKSELLFGVDHIPEFVSFRNMHDDRIINDVVDAVQPEKPLFAAEFQSGSREYHVVTSPVEMELFYKASIANGLKGWNYYMFSQGRNTRQRGYSGDTFYWFTPLTAEGQRTTAYPLIQKMSKLISAIEPLIISSRPKSELCVLFYPPYYSTELERPETGASELIFVPSMIRRPAWFDGVLRALQALNVEFEIRDLTRTNPQELSRYKQVWTFSTDEMNETDQRTLLRFVRDGGNLVIFPAIPYREMSQKPCSLLRDAFNAHPEAIETIDSPLIDLLGLNDIKCANPQLVYGTTTLENATVIALTLTGKPCGFLKPYGNGVLIHLGTWLGFDTEAHKAAYEVLLRLSNAALNTAGCDNSFIRVRQRFTSHGEGILFVGNYFNEDHKGSVSYT